MLSSKKYSSCLLVVLFALALTPSNARFFRQPKPLVIFSDGNLDDTLATLHALADDHYVVGGICVAGTGFSSLDGGVDTALRAIQLVIDNTNHPRKIAELQNVIVARGLATPLSDPINLQTAILDVQNPPIRFLSDSLWGTKDLFFPNTTLTESSLSCTEMMQYLYHRNFQIDVLSTGTDTDLAQAYRDDPALTYRIRRHVRMGGAVTAPGNLFSYPTNTLAEFNIYLDPVASNEILSKDHLILVPLDATSDVPITRDIVSSLATISTHTAQWYSTVLGIVAGAFGEASFYNDDHVLGGGYFWWDDLAYQALIDHRCDVEFLSGLQVDTSVGPNNPSGNVVKSFDTRLHRVCYGMDPEEMTEKFLHWLENEAV